MGVSLDVNKEFQKKLALGTETRKSTIPVLELIKPKSETTITVEFKKPKSRIVRCMHSFKYSPFARLAKYLRKNAKKSAPQLQQERTARAIKKISENLRK